MNYAQTRNLAGLIPGRFATTQEPARPESIRQHSGREIRETHVVKKLLLIVAMLLVIGQLVWALG